MSNIKKKRIAIVVPELLPVPPEEGGAVEYWVDEVSKRFNEVNYDVSCVSRPASSISKGSVAYIGIPWTPIEKFFFKVKSSVSSSNPLRQLAKFQNVYSYGRRAMRAVSGFDYVYIHNEPNLMFFLKNTKGQRVILHMHNNHLNIRWLIPFYRRALRKVDIVICVSNYIRDQIIQTYPEYKQKVITVDNATDTDQFKPYGPESRQKLSDYVSFEEGKHYILYAGRLNAEKGVHILLEAFLKISQNAPNARLIIAGSSFFAGATTTPFELKLREIASDLKDKIVFTGFIPHNKMKYLFSAVDIVVVPSVWNDPAPLSALEAMSSGACLIGTKVGGIQYFIRNEIDGLLVSSADIEALKKAMERVMADTGFRDRLGFEARQRALNYYSWGRLMKELEMIFGELK